VKDIIVSPEAEADLRGIWMYSFETSGEAQADTYLNELDAAHGRACHGANRVPRGGGGRVGPAASAGGVARGVLPRGCGGGVGDPGVAPEHGCGAAVTARVGRRRPTRRGGGRVERRLKAKKARGELKRLRRDTGE